MLTPTRATALHSPLGAYRGWSLYPRCVPCRITRQLRIDDLADQMGPGTLLRDVLPCLRCSRCGNPPRAVKLSDGGGPSAREVWLMGGPRAG